VDWCCSCLIFFSYCFRFLPVVVVVGLEDVVHLLFFAFFGLLRKKKLFFTLNKVVKIHLTLNYLLVIDLQVVANEFVTRYGVGVE
jgi:hypothetical protein